MLRRTAGVVAVSGALLLAGAGAAHAAPGDYDGHSEDAPAPAPVTPDASGGSIEVTVTSTGSTAEGSTFSTTARASVRPDCWLGPGPSGYEYYEYWKPGGPARDADTLDDFAAQGLLHPAYETYATDTAGRWYEPTCRFDVDARVAGDYYLSHTAVYVMPGDPPPPADVVVDPRMLADIASEHMQLPTGTIHWNPSVTGSGATVVGMDTWVWVEGAATTVQVTASVPGVWARVDARMASMRLSAPHAADATCPDTGTPYGPGMTSSTCAVVFERSTAGMPVKAGQTYPTATLTATATWEATWVSSLDATPQALEAQTVTTSAEVPVAEIQTIVTR